MKQPEAKLRHSPLPPNLAPRGLRREQAATYIGISPIKFDAMVRDGRMPPAKRIDSIRVWDRRQIDAAFDRLPDGESTVAQQDEDAEWEFRA